MMRSFPVMMTFLLIGFVGNAQLKGFGLGPYVELATPTGNFNETNSSGIGIGLGTDIGFGRLKLTGSAGYIHFGGKTIATAEGTTTTPAVNAFPLRAGLKYRFAPLFYFKLESGVANYTNNNGSAVILSPGFGLRVLGLDVQAKFETWIHNGSSSFWGLKAGYNF
jgi:hypothetical protein